MDLMNKSSSTHCDVPQSIREFGMEGEPHVLHKAASNPEQDDVSNEPPLFRLVATNDAAFKSCLDAHPCPNGVVATDNCRNDLLLHRAVRCGWVDMAKCLIEDGRIHVDTAKRDGATALFIAAQEGHPDLVNLLINHGADLDLSDEDGISPLYIASYQGHLAIVKILLDAGANPNHLGKDSTSPLYIASQEGYAEIVHLLACRGAAINGADREGTTPLLMASQEGRIAAVAVLLSFGANVSLATSRGVQPVHSAAQNGHLKILQMLMAYGSDVHILTQSGTTAALLANDFQHVDIIEWIASSLLWNPLRICAAANLHWVAEHLLVTGKADTHLSDVTDILAVRSAAKVGTNALARSTNNTDAVRTAKLFRRATAPWCIPNHRFHGQPFRDTVYLVMLIRQRLNNGERHPCHPPVPEEMWLAILGFLTRRNCSDSDFKIQRAVTFKCPQRNTNNTNNATTIKTNNALNINFVNANNTDTDYWSDDDYVSEDDAVVPDFDGNEEDVFFDAPGNTNLYENVICLKKSRHLSNSLQLKDSDAQLKDSDVQNYSMNNNSDILNNGNRNNMDTVHTPQIIH